MQATTKNWLCHFVYPHKMHDVSTEWHDMFHDTRFWTLTFSIIGVAVITGMIAMTMWLGDYEGPLQYFRGPWRYF